MPANSRWNLIRALKGYLTIYTSVVTDGIFTCYLPHRVVPTKLFFPVPRVLHGLLITIRTVTLVLSANNTSI